LSFGTQHWHERRGGEGRVAPKINTRNLNPNTPEDGCRIAISKCLYFLKNYKKTTGWKNMLSRG